LDAREAVPPSLQRTTENSKVLRTFAGNMTALDIALREAKPDSVTPPGMHASIMRAVQAAERSAAVQAKLPVLRWVPVAAAVALAAVGLWWARQPAKPPAPGPLATAVDALELRNELIRTAPDTVMAPLSEELARLNRDVNNTAQLLLAALP
jgi:hypothetical protein